MDKLLFVKWAREARLSEKCMKKHRIVEYDPGHVRYQLGHTPTRKPYYPTEDDWRLLDLYAEKGVSVIHLWGSNVFSEVPAFGPTNEDGIRRFVDECHRRKLKIIPYVSPGYVDVRSSFYNAAWDSNTPHLKEVYYDLARMCPGSPGWRSHFFDRVDRLLDEFAYDGLYWDAGFSPECRNPKHDNHIHFTESQPGTKDEEWDHLDEDVDMHKVKTDFWELWNEFISEIYVRVKRRKGIVVAHITGDMASPFTEKYWDYQLIGEGVPDMVASVDRTKQFQPYVIRFNDWSQLVTNWRNRDYTPRMELIGPIEHLSMAGYVPYLQFPWLEDGNYGEKEDIYTIPSVPWKKEFDIWTEWMKAQERVGFPPVMGASFLAGRDRYLKYFEVYRRMTTENTTVYMETRTSEATRFPSTEDSLRVSVFLNDSLWVAAGNLGIEPREIMFGPLTGFESKRSLTLPGGRLVILRYHNLISPPETILFPE